MVFHFEKPSKFDFKPGAVRRRDTVQSYSHFFDCQFSI
jgi:hypothetical protein